MKIILDKWSHGWAMRYIINHNIWWFEYDDGELFLGSDLDGRFYLSNFWIEKWQDCL